MKGDRKAGAPWGPMDGAKLCWEPRPLLVCGQEGLSSAADVLQRTLRNSADIIVSITAALRSKYKRATLLQLHQWHGKAQVTVKEQESNKHKKVDFRRKRQVKVKGRSFNSYFSKNKILSSKGIESRVSKRYLYPHVHRALFAIAKRSRNPSVH